MGRRVGIVNQALVICDACGRVQPAGSDGLSRLSYCPSCQRFACATCWFPARGTCRQCLLGGTAVTPRLTPRIRETFERSSRVAYQVPISVSPTAGPSRELGVRSAAGGSHHRHGSPWWRGLVALAVVLAAAGLFAMNVRTADRPPTRPAAVSAQAALPTAKQSTAPAQPTAVQTYTVTTGDSLTSIAAAVYGDESMWPLIHQANRTAIPDPDNLRVGQSLVIPPP